MLWKICYENQTTNILFLAKDKQLFEDLLKSEFYDLKEKEDEYNISILFSLRKKLFLSFIAHSVMKSSKTIEAETVFVYTADKGIHYNLDYQTKTADGLYLMMPPILSGSEDLPEPMRKIFLTFTAKDGTAYRIETRVIRFHKDKNGRDYMVCAHSDHLMPLQKRMSERMDTDLDVQFAAVKIEKQGTGKKQTVSFVPLERRYPGKLLDISTGGCRMVTRLPIKPEQHIYIEGMFNMQEMDHAVGIILRNTKRKDGLIVLHIKFVQIERAVVNRILAMVSHYD